MGMPPPNPFDAYVGSWCAVHQCPQAARAALAEVEVSIARQREDIERRRSELASQLEQLHVVKDGVEREQRQLAFDRAELAKLQGDVEAQRVYAAMCPLCH